MLNRALLQRLLIIALVLSFVFPVGGWLAAQWVFRPDNAFVGALPADLSGERVTLRTSDNVILPAWLLKGDADKGGVLLLHGRGGSRLGMLGRARFLSELGYTVLMLDFRGQGEAGAALRGLGLAEVSDVEAALAFFHKVIGNRKLAIIGVSKGAAAAAFSGFDSPVSALVLESVYGNLQEAATARLEEHIGPWAGSFGRAFAAPLAFGMGLGLGVDLISPRLALSKLTTPKLIISGDQDNKPTWAQTEATFAQAAEPKSLLRIRGAGHEDLHAFAKQEWEGAVTVFLQQHLKGSVERAVVTMQPQGFADVPEDQ